MTALELPALLQAFFTDRLLKQRRASAHTVTAYRNAFRLLLRFAAGRLGRAPSQLRIADLDAKFLGEFLDHLERVRGNSARTRRSAGRQRPAASRLARDSPSATSHPSRN